MKISTWRGETLVKIENGVYETGGFRFEAPCDGRAIALFKAWVTL